MVLFLVAMIVYVVLFKQKLPHSLSSKKKIEKKVAPDEPEESAAVPSAPTRTTAETYDQVDAAFRSAVDAGDHRAALRCWSSFKQFNKRAPLAHLQQAVESMQLSKKDGPFIVKEIQALVKKFPKECDMAIINDLLAYLGQRHDTQLMEMLAEKLTSMGLAKDSQTYEILIGTHFTTRSFDEVQRVVSEMQSKQVPFTAKAIVTLIKTALRTSNFQEALRYFCELKSSLPSDKSSSQ